MSVSERRTMARYALFQIPDLILLSLGCAVAVRWWDFPLLAAYGLVAAWIAKDVILYPVLRVAYESGAAHGADALLGALGVVVEPLAPAGYVRVGSERWRAEFARDAETAPVGSTVRVVELRGLTLLVEPADPEPS